MDLSSSSSEGSFAKNWVSWFLSSKGNEYFCEVDEEYILDRFNLTGLNSEVEGYTSALEVITDTLDDDMNDEQRDQLEASARHLYGLIHARFTITSRGLAKMNEKFKKAEFGRCPRVLCYNQHLLPIGLSDISGAHGVKLYCPRCEDVYSPKSSRHSEIDGAYFGTTFPHMMLMVYPAMIPNKTLPISSGMVNTSVTAALVGGGSGGTSPSQGPLSNNVVGKVERVRPRIFGFMVHEAARLQRWQESIREEQLARLEQIDRPEGGGLGD